MPGNSLLIAAGPAGLACAYLAGAALLIALPRSTTQWGLVVFSLCGVLLPLYACQFAAGFLLAALRDKSGDAGHPFALVDWRFLRAVYRHTPRADGERRVWSLFLFAHPLAVGTVPVLLGVVQKG